MNFFRFVSKLLLGDPLKQKRDGVREPVEAMRNKIQHKIKVDTAIIIHGISACIGVRAVTSI